MLHLRQPNGDLEWDCPLDAAQPTTLRAYLRDRVMEVNRRRHP
ncbi:hypothetical protein ACFP1Z_16630 [Streptomyces gamaensis]|uniref:Uncharacterized protein n=1 Tax=Streptomyces gamaensis TaxID=1763542 RepID=A0ABW0YYW1_9ACTN